MLVWILFGVGGLIIIALGIYAGRLLYLLSNQSKRQEKARNKRIEKISESVRTISFAMQQQQCDPSEGVIRLCNLLDAMPLDPQPEYKALYPGIYELHARIYHFPTHEARQALSKQERRKQDKEREQIESEMSSLVNKDIDILRYFNTR